MLSFATTLRNSIASTVLTSIGSAAGSNAKILLCSGTRPANGATTPTPLATFTVTGALFASTSGAVGTLNAIPAVAATGGGAGTAATWARLTTSANAFVCDMDVTVTGGSGDLTMDNVTVVTAATLTPGTLTLTVL